MGYFSQSSVRNGDAGSPAPLYRLPSGLLAQAYRTATGSLISAFDTMTELPSIRAWAGFHAWSLSATWNPFNSADFEAAVPSADFVVRPSFACLKFKTTSLPRIV